MCRTPPGADRGRGGRAAPRAPAQAQAKSQSARSPGTASPDTPQLQGQPSGPLRPKPPAESQPRSTTRVRTLRLVLSLVIGTVLLVSPALYVAWRMGRASDSTTFNVSVGDCVKRSGDKAVKAACNDSGAYQVVSIVDSEDQCIANQPHVLNPTTDGKTQALCLRPAR